jgi:NADH:ubiquinone reductase (H+-translocating)
MILGGGYGGVQAAKILTKRFGTSRDVEITLVDRNPYHTLMTELHEVAGARVAPQSVRISFQKIFGSRRITLVTDSIRTIDFQAQKLIADGREYGYDYLVLGVGGEPEYYGIPGIKENSFALWSFEDALKIRRHIEDTFEAAARERDPGTRAEMLTFVVAGAGFTGVELAGELKDWRRVLCAEHHMEESEVRIIVVEALDKILPNLPEKLQHKARRYLEKRGVEFALQSPIVGAEKGKVLLSGGKSIGTRTFIWTCGIQGCEFAGNLALTKGKCTNRMCRFATTQGTCGVKECTFSKDRYIEGKRGRLLTNEYMQSVDYANVYIVGDVGWYLEGKRVVPQIVENAVQTAETAAHNIIADITDSRMKPFRSNYRGIMVSLGTYYGVAHVMGVSLSWLFAIGVKHMINVIHLLGVAGVNQVWEYVKHEFLDVKNSRSFIGGLASYRIRGYWPLLLRLWLGFMWVVEATNKITEGYLDFSSGRSKTGWMFSPGVVQAGQAAADATSAATAAAGAAAGAAQAAADATSAATAAAGAAQAAADATSAATAAAGAAAGAAQATTAASQAAGAAAGAAAAHGPWLDLTKPILDPNWGFVTWVRRTFMDGIFAYLPYSVFQVFIVMVELLIGLALFGGFFTWWAAVVSLGMCIIFTCTGMFAWNQAWFFFAGILMLGGVGRAFGLDSWTVPFFKRWWNGTRLARRTYLYADEPVVRGKKK